VDVKTPTLWFVKTQKQTESKKRDSEMVAAERGFRRVATKVKAENRRFGLKEAVASYFPLYSCLASKRYFLMSAMRTLSTGCVRRKPGVLLAGMLEEKRSQKLTAFCGS
jgi:hypothetical protein